ncbi:hypothetical protein NE237_015886 [Protea cynaroides]|uniref:Uncharacterized protein n=1 Tax=Protea cynaroides TaxID=273540 RepID=A0A9Q0KEW8_9MAGN|nr:hypothetical protein NE237_015886 [Protea cynaroides]
MDRWEIVGDMAGVGSDFGGTTSGLWGIATAVTSVNGWVCYSWTWCQEAAEGAKDQGDSDEEVEAQVEGLKLRRWGRKRHYSAKKATKKKKKPSMGVGETFGPPPAKFDPGLELNVEHSALKDSLVAEHMAWHIHLPRGIDAYTELIYLAAYSRAPCNHFEVHSLDVC